MLQAFCSRSLALTLLLSPLTGICVVTVLRGRSIGVGVQPAHLAAAVLALGCLWLRRRWSFGPRVWVLVAAVIWTLASTSALWGLDEIGLAGEAPWSKGLKQLVLLGVGIALVVAPALVLRGAPEPAAELRRWERATTAGLALVAAYGLYQAAAFYLTLPGESVLARWVSSNPSVASGSAELYLGHRFVGIPRVSSTGCEPLYFASYLLLAVPIAVGGAVAARGAGRAWRLVVAASGTVCFVLTFARGAYLGAFVLVTLVGLGARRGTIPRPRGRRAGGIAVASLAGITVGVALLTGRAPWELPALLIDRVAQTLAGHDMSNLTRLYSWRVAAALGLQHPVGGIGWGGYGFWYFPLAQAGQASAHFGWPTPNSLPLQLLAETGLIGVALWGAAVWPLMRDSVRGSSLAAGPLPAARFLMGTVVLAAWVQALTYYQIHLLYFFLLHGVASAIQERGRPAAGTGRLV